MPPFSRLNWNGGFRRDRNHVTAEGIPEREHKEGKVKSSNSGVDIYLKFLQKWCIKRGYVTTRQEESHASKKQNLSRR